MKKRVSFDPFYITTFACCLVILTACFTPQSAFALDKSPQVQGYASASSVPQGESIDFHTSTNVPTYSIQIFRERANGRELMMTIPDLPGNAYRCQDAVGVPVEDDEEPLGCNWPAAYTLSVPTTWPSGMYVADLLDEDDQPGGYGSYIFFIVTEDQPGSTSNILFLMPTNTWQAYNDYDGWSLYTDPQAVKITFDRPYKSCTNCVYRWELPLLRWLESEGYSIEFVSSEDIHNDPNLLFNYTLFLIVGHDEYWSKEMRDHLDAFMAAGGNCAIFSGNTMYRQVRFEDQMRTIVGYKKHWKDDPMYKVDDIRVTREFKNFPIEWPQNATIGLGWTGWVNTSPESSNKGRYTVYRSDHWIYNGTGLQDMDEFWYEPKERVEVDGTAFILENGLPIVTGDNETPLNFVILGIEPSNKGHATMGIYTHPGGGAVFNAATFGWPRGLLPEYNPDDYQIVQQITRNIINTLTSDSSPPIPTDNQRPQVDAGFDQNIALPDDSVFLDATVTDDGLPDPPGAVITTWSQVSGTSTVSFDDASAVNTWVTFPEAGTYVLQLEADDGQLTGNDTVTIMVNNEVGTEVTTIERRVATGSDDAEETTSGAVSLTSSDLELINDKGSDQTVGLRFVDVNIPQGVTITDAFVQFQVDEANWHTTSLTIKGEDTDDAQPFIFSKWAISSRTPTMAAVNWSPAVWASVGDAGAEQQTPDIAPIIQEIVNRPGWSSGNSLVLIITGTGKRVAESYNGKPDAAPLLHIEYNTGPATNQRPQVDAGFDQNIALPDDSVFLDATVTDDGLPDPSGAVITTWSQVSGTSTVSFDDASAVNTWVTFPEAGTYVLQLEADDGQLTGNDTVTIVVNEAGENVLPIIIIKADDLERYPESSLPVKDKWERFVYIVETHFIKASIGIICISLYDDDQEYFNWINSMNKRGRIEFWMHGLTHEQWETDGTTFYEFKNTSYEYQKSHIEKAQELAKRRIPLTLVTFGAPFNQIDENTERVLEEIPDIKIWLFGPHNTNMNNLIILHRSSVNLEYPIGNPDFEEFKTNYERNLGLDYIVLQGHPGGWDDHDFNEFERIIHYLKERGSIFMTPVEYFYANQGR